LRVLPIASPQPTEITNVYAVLKGVDQENARRIVRVTGHYAEFRQVGRHTASHRTLVMAAPPSAWSVSAF